ncbi:ABC transporter permease [Deinococcus aquiradiocola]|uniref:ABC transporter permease n=1 Tax=Deinococcus aquiradiocola TaxID=393059 RepID=A0A917UI82_9DEIO|nr:iron ABC transporter permease [Deinococcus aquiradiocola]GGJ60421.1 ABC transporter permease [Deinococcus aquiradiocola]
MTGRNAGGRAWRGWALAAVPLAFLLAFLLLPLLRVLALGGARLGILGEGYFQARLAWTFWQATLTALLALALGGPLAYLLARYHLPGKAALLRLLLLPFVTPTLVAALGLLSLFGPRGLTGLDLSETPALILLGNLFFNLPLMVRLGYAGFLRVPPNLNAAARTLGAGGVRAALQVSLPLAWPGLAAGAVLVFLYSALSFGLPLLLGGERYATLEVEIYTLTAYELRLPEASALILVQLAVTLLATLLYLRLGRAAGGGVPVARDLPRPTGWAALATYGLTVTVLLLCFAPLVAVAVRSVTGRAGWTTAFWTGLLQASDPGVGLLLGNTLRFAGLTLAASVLLGLLHAVATYVTRSRLLDVLSLLPLMVSPVSLAVGYLILYPSLRAQLPLLIAAYSLLATPLVVRSVLPALRAVPPHVPEAARTLGAARAGVWRSVLLPLTLPALRGGAALSLATVLGEFAATLVLTRPEWATLSTGMYERLGRPGEQNLGEACALATLLMLLALTVFSVLDGGKGEVT